MYLEQETTLQQVLSADRKTAHLVPTWQDLKVLKAIDKALSPLADFTGRKICHLFSSESYFEAHGGQ